MATRTLRIDLEVQVRDLTEAEWNDQLPPRDPDEFGDEGPSLDDGLTFDPNSSEVEATTAFEVAEIVVGLFHDEAIREALAGSNMMVMLSDDPVVIAAEWLPEGAA